MPFALVALLGCFPGPLHAGTKTWDGGGTGEHWASNLPWAGNSAPVTGDDLVWPANGYFGATTDNDFPTGTTFRSIEIASAVASNIAGTRYGWTHQGNRITLTGGLDATGEQFSVTRFEVPITLGAGPSPGGHLIFCSSHELILSGAINMGTEDLELRGVTVFNVNGEGRITMDAAISGSGTLTLDGNGSLLRANSMTGIVDLEGFWDIHHAGAFGTTNQRTEVSGGLNWFPATCSEPLLMQYGQVQLRFLSPAGTVVDAPIEMNADENHVYCVGNTSLNGPLSGSNGAFWPIIGPGAVLTIGGSTPNTFSQTVIQRDGILALNKAGGNALESNFIHLRRYYEEDAPGTLRWLRSNQIGDNATLDLEWGARAEVNGFSDTVKSLMLEEAEASTGAGILTLTEQLYGARSGDNNGVPDPIRFSGNLRLASPTGVLWTVNGEFTELELTANVFVAPGSATVVNKNGSGTLVWSGLSSGLTQVQIQSGVLDYHGPSAGLDIAVSTTGGFIARDCTVRDITFAAATGESSLEFAGGATSNFRHMVLNPGVTLERRLYANEINNYGIASGTVDLGGAKLELSADFTVGTIGSEFIIIGKSSSGLATGSLTDAATGVPVAEGQLFTVRDWIVRFSYQGGDGNDVALKLVSFVPEGRTRTWLGSGGNNLWDNDNNWDVSISPGFTCVFPGVTNRTPVHNYPGGTILEKVIVTADGYSFLGNEAGLLSGVQANYATGQTLFNCPVILAGNQSYKAFQSAHLRCGTTGNGRTDLNGWTLTLDAAAAGATVEIGVAAAGTDPPAAITGAGAVFKRGPGDVILYAPSSFTGLTTVVQGRLRLGRSPLALGAAGLSNGTVVSTGTTLDLAFPGGVFPETVAMNGGTLQIDAGAGNLITAQGEVQGNGGGGTVTVLTGQLNVSGGVTGTRLTKHGFGTVQLLGSAPFTMSDRVVVDSGPLLLARVAGSNAAVRCEVTGSGSVLRLGAADQLAGLVTLDSSGALDLNGHHETLPELRLQDGTVTTGAGTLTCPLISTSGLLGSTLSGKLAIPAGGTLLDVLNDDPGVDLTLGAAVSGSTLTVTGGGTVVLSGTNVFAAAQLNDGKADFNGTNTAAVTLNGGTVAGTGTVGSITAGAGGGFVSPGASTGILNCGNLSLNAASIFLAELNGATPATGHDQLNVTGTVNLGGAALQLLSFPGATGIMIIINNDGAEAVTGTFAGLPENTLIAAGGKSFRISYVGGTGNDVTLTLVVTGTGVTKTWTGLGANNQWTTAANWAGGIAPVAGDDLVFPAGPFVKTCNNTFPAGTTFNSIRIGDSGYGLAGNGIGLNAGIVFDYATNVSSVALDVTLAGPQSFTVLQGAQAVVIPSTALTTAGFPLTAQVDGAAARLTLNLLSGTGGLVKTGIGGLTMNVNNWTGPVTLSGGETKTGTLSGFGTGTSAIVVQSGAELRFENIASGTFTRGLILSGKLEFSASPITLSGAISLATGGQRVVEVTGTTPSLSGVLSGAGSLRKTGTGSLTLSGATANTFTGGCTVADGTLRLQKSSGIVALQGPVTIGDDAGTDILLFAAANQIGNAATVNLLGSGAQMQCGTFSDTIGALRFTGGSVTGSGTLTVGERLESFAAATTATVDVNFVPSVSPFPISVADGAAAVDLAMASDWLGAATLDADRDGPGTFSLRSGTMRTLTLHEGTTLVTGLFNAADILLSGGTLGGDGITTAVTTVAGKRGQLAPGASPGQFTVSTWTGDENTSLNMEAGGTAPGTQHDQLIVSGVAEPKGATLTLVPLAGYTPQRGQSLKLIQNDGGDRMASEFSLLPEGATFEFGGTTAQITYSGGDGNDVVVAILSTNSTGITRVWDGGGANNLWMTPGNWGEDTAPAEGDTLLFPGAVPQLGSSNNFPAGTNFHRIIITGSGVNLSGNAIALNAGISSTHPSTAFFSIPVTLTGPQTFSADGQGDLTVTSSATVSLNGHTLTFDINSTGDLRLQNAITGIGGVRCDSIGTGEGTGFGRVQFSAASGYSGAFTVVQGGVHLSHPGTLGTSASVSSTGALFVDATANPVFSQPVTLRGGLVAEGGTARYNGHITLPAGAQGVIGGDNTILAGRIQSTGALLVSMNFGQSLTLTGTLANTYTGGTTVLSGDVILQKTAGITALPGPVEIHSTVRLAAAGQIADTAALTMQEGSLLDLAGFNDTMASLTMTGSSVSTGTGLITLTGGLSTLPSATTCTLSGNLTHTGAGVHEWSVAPGSAEPELQCDTIVTTSAGVIVRKTGSGTVGFGGACAMSDFQVAGGVVFWNGTAPGTFIMMDGGTLSGLGMANQITSAAGGGEIAPGTSPGTLHCNNIHWNAATTFTVEINGPAPGAQHDQIAIEDESTLGGATLDLQLNYLPATGESFTIIDSGGTGVLDTFAGLPEGAHFFNGTQLFRITYAGGDGNDVVLTTVFETAPELLSHSLIPGVGAEAGQTVIDVTATAVQGLGYVLESSRELQTWTPLQTATAGPGGTVTFRATESAALPRCFYRARRQ